MRGIINAHSLHETMVVVYRIVAGPGRAGWGGVLSLALVAVLIWWAVV